MAEAFIIDAVRTPVGKRGGGLAGVHSADLGAHVIQGLTKRTDFDPGAVEDVIFGCCDTIGSQAGDIARTCWLAAGLPDHVPGVTIDRQCGSSQQSVHFAAQAVMSGTSDLIVAGGVQNMSQIPISSAMTCAESLGFTDPFSGSKGWLDRRHLDDRPAELAVDNPQSSLGIERVVDTSDNSTIERSGFCFPPGQLPPDPGRAQGDDPGGHRHDPARDRSGVRGQGGQAGASDR